MTRILRPLLLTCAAGTLLLGQRATAQGQLTLERIFASSDFRLESYPSVQWMRDGQRFTYVNDDGDLVVVQAASGDARVLLPADALRPAGAAEPIEIEDYQWSQDEQKLLVYTNTQRVWRSNTKGQYYVWDVAARTLTPVSSRPGWQQFAKFSPDGTRVGFVRDNDLYVTELASGAETRLTRDGSEAIINGTFDWVYEEELGLQDGWRWSPDGRRIAFWRIDQSAVRTFFMVQETDSLYPNAVSFRYPKAGTPNPSARVGVVDLGSGATTWMDTGTGPDIYLARMEWAGSADAVMVQRLNRHQNRMEVLLHDPATGGGRTLFTETDSAWVDIHDDFAWLDQGRQFLYASERDGYNHLYLYGRDGRLLRQLTRGPWDVVSVAEVDERGGWVYFVAAREHPSQRHVYRVRLNGRGGMELVTPEPGSHSVAVSPGGTFLLDFHSRAGVPTVTRLRRGNGQVVRVLEENARVRDLLPDLRVQPQEFFTLQTSDGTSLNGWMIKPPDFDPTRRYPVLMYVYGGPGSQTVLDSWGGSRFLWHQLLAQRGYIVVSVDNRGTGSRGRDFKKLTYLNLGEHESADQVEAARWLARQPYVDPGRIGIWGWSYGGYMTALTMMREDSPFKAGVSVAPVAHWGLYDTIYTERYMRTPQENPEGYRRSAPTQHAANLRGNLLLIHGTGDDNVHFQNSVRLADALQDAGKQFTFMAYPDRTHSISGGRTTMHLYTLITDWILENL